ncbi:D,D-dipeptide ABC transporter permease [Verminephrobacter eiseniae]|uniref:Binding-protein-dependent transport systems inner membrane component n=1 Tax=Verminephrobacter eiseniae (strain EF01-2) TaxID=391735 RepID=A1WQB7_VEREI|nr:D,D-dipeptide ABC transporter permease [Verminephrobacter eiseniae]ABM59824.1 binding-protein-dependent transport systems inner membrane component [Verminephrobacter eiseniae EF01-2]MCW5260188.1 D,D-dipeptide ABC transporter permease [Verminephrobacter eiseniae]MCW5285337.1 D,D-dipeptide ABC transporter permease [Verminephrobacter eiseniae]MCW5303044.1 D,D-dipeptide ABC transporter permease [Verminephrobacter eiseniae]MCW8181405.1 D,D-dipeptide ABC transporter permease [Verminephrobacter ei
MNGPDWDYLAYRLRRSPLTLLGLCMVALVLLAILVGPWLLSTDPDRIDLRSRLAAPSAAHWFGTDEVGRDIFTRVLHGGRISVGIGFFVVLVSATLGSILGGLSGVIGGKMDTAIMRLMDIVLSVPSLVLTMALAAALGPSLWNAMLALALVRIPAYVRLARGQTLTIRESGYVLAARSFGAKPWQILRWHVALNALPPISVQASLDLGSAILMAAALSFIGLGAQPPAAEWGAMIAVGRHHVLEQWWYSAFPGMAILFTAVGFNFLGDGLRDMLDPKHRQP